MLLWGLVMSTKEKRVHIEMDAVPIMMTKDDSHLLAGSNCLYHVQDDEDHDLSMMIMTIRTIMIMVQL